MLGEAWGLGGHCQVSWLVRVQLKVQGTLSQSLMLVKQVDDCAGDWLLEVLGFHAVDLDANHTERLQVLDLEREDEDIIKLIGVLGPCVLFDWLLTIC